MGKAPTLKMSESQESHLIGIKERTANLLDQKYRRGAAEHGGNLFDLDALALVDNAIEEAIDQLTYLLTIRDKLTKAQPRTLDNEELSRRFLGCQE